MQKSGSKSSSVFSFVYLLWVGFARYCTKRCSSEVQDEKNIFGGISGSRRVPPWVVLASDRQTTSAAILPHVKALCKQSEVAKLTLLLADGDLVEALASLAPPKPFWGCKSHTAFSKPNSTTPSRGVERCVPCRVRPPPHQTVRAVFPHTASRVKLSLPIPLSSQHQKSHP